MALAGRIGAAAARLALTGRGGGVRAASHAPALARLVPAWPRGGRKQISHVPDYEAKYRDKLLQRARERGAGSIDELKQQLKQQSKQQQQQQQQQPTQQTKDAAPGDDTGARERRPRAAGLPPNVKALNDIMRVELLESKSSEEVGQIWNAYHAGRDGISAAIPGGTYRELAQVARRNPLFVLPLPRSEGVEFFLLQVDFHQVHFTSLLEYKTDPAAARPYLTLTHYTDLLDSKDVVLMRGEIDRHLDPHSAQCLALLMQQFYVSGGPEKRRLLEQFNQNPAEFDYKQLVDAAARL
ncbi:hypothetical protein H4R18_005125 [Coemansia javaensis]|uniref:ATP11-domain-containing protein n=1 Tax=Coemansia javaensis TaxID=2761396 RepID=A0A9W8H2Z3_9FUNG|nr:hypothetical protein H4R18_005125 [Coemansia javaensis]